MAIVSGTLTDVRLEGLADRSAEILWTPSSAATTLDGKLVSALPVVTVVSGDSSWSEDLVSSEVSSPPITYSLRVRLLSLSPDLPPVWLDFPGVDLFVPNEGGSISDLWDMATTGGVVWEVAGSTIPALARPGDLMLNTLASDLYRIG